MSVHLLEASREKQTMAEVAVTEKQIAEIAEAEPKDDVDEAEAKDDILPPEAGGKTLTFLTKGGETVVVDSANEAQVMKIITEPGFKIASLRKVGTHLQLDEEFVASATAAQLTNKIQAMFYERDSAAKAAETKRLQETLRRLMELPAETEMESLQRINGSGGGGGAPRQNPQQNLTTRPRSVCRIRWAPIGGIRLRF